MPVSKFPFGIGASIQITPPYGGETMRFCGVVVAVGLRVAIGGGILGICGKKPNFVAGRDMILTGMGFSIWPIIAHTSII